MNAPDPDLARAARPTDGTPGGKAEPAPVPGGRRPWKRLARAIGDVLPKGLYARSLIIIIAPVVLLQSVIAYTFMERHWQLVTKRLSSAVTADVAALIDIYESYPQDRDAETLSRIAGERLNLDLDILKGAKLPPPGPRPFFSILDEALSDEIQRQIRRPFWIDTVGRSNLIEIRVAIPDGVMRITARRSQAYASNSHIFLVWMIGSSLVLLGVAILFLRNQIKPILRLAAVAEGFGKGREIEFRPRGAREVRQAGHAFIEMKRRIERAMEQRTTMLNGVSHDLRTVLTRFRLSLALVEQTSEIEDMARDVDEMSRMLEGYLAFARGDSAEPAAATDMRALLGDLRTDVERLGAHVSAVDLAGAPEVTVRPDAFRRCLFNLAANAARYGETVAISGRREARAFLVSIDDDGPGIPPESREEVFKPFVRLDDARQDAGGSGLGLAIARDIARAHGGDISLHDSPLGGLRATVQGRSGREPTTGAWPPVCRTVSATACRRASGVKKRGGRGPNRGRAVLCRAPDPQARPIARRIRVPTMNPLVPLFIVISLPLAAIGLVLYTDTGIEPSLFYASVKTFVILGVIAVAMSFGAMKLSERAKS